MKRQALDFARFEVRIQARFRYARDVDIDCTRGKNDSGPTRSNAAQATLKWDLSPASARGESANEKRHWNCWKRCDTADGNVSAIVSLFPFQQSAALAPDAVR